MVNPLLLLPLAFSIESVSTVQGTDSVTVEMHTSEPVAARQVRGLKGPHRLYLFVQDGDASHVNKQSGKIQVLQRSRYAKFEVVLPDGVACQEPALVEPIADGVRARYTCTGGTAEAADSPAELPAPRTQAREILQAALALPDNQAFRNEAAAEAPAPAPAARAAAPRAATPQPQEPAPTAAPPAAPRVEAKAEPVAAVRPTPEPVAVRPEPVAAEAAPAPTVTAPAAKPEPTKAPADAAPALTSVKTSSSTTGLSVVAPALLLLALAGGAFVLNRRRVRRQGIIQILETASIGPKRSLLVARVDGRTMVLGASEAGISLLQSLDGRAPALEPAPAPAANPAARAAASDSAVASLEAALAASPAAPEAAPEASPESLVRERAPAPAAQTEPENEGGLLRRLFARAVRPAAPAPDFQALLDESFEDQELRRKLAQGLSARVS